MTTWHEMLDSITAEEKRNPPPKGEANGEAEGEAKGEGGAAAEGKEDAEGKEGATEAGEPVKGEAAAAPNESPSKPPPKARP